MDLILALPRELSRLNVYAFVQEQLELFGLSLPLDSIVIVRDDEPGLRELLDLAGSVPTGTVRDGAGIEFAGRVYSDPRRVRLTGRVYERAVGTMLAGLPGIILEEADQWQESLSVPWHVPISLRPDFVVRGQANRLVVEAKIFSQKNLNNRFVESLGKVAYWERRLNSRLGLLIITNEAIPSNARALYSGLIGAEMVAWAPGNAPVEVVEALDRLQTRELHR
jgi:hypothetical protein